MAKCAWFRRVLVLASAFVVPLREATREPVEHQGTAAITWNPRSLPHVEGELAGNRIGPDVGLNQRSPPKKMILKADAPQNVTLTMLVIRRTAV
jgi:hypothetical protein